MPSVMTIPFTGAWHRSRTVAVRTSFEAQALSCVDNLYGVAVRLARTPAEAEDLVCETYAQAFRDAGPPNGKTLKFWLFTILYSSIRTAHRNIAFEPIALEADSDWSHGVRVPPHSGESPDQRLTATLSDADLKAALESLPDSIWQVIWLRDVEDFSCADIAQILSMPIATVGFRIGRGRRLLYERLSALRNAPEEVQVALRQEGM